MATAIPSRSAPLEYSCISCGKPFQRRPGGRATCNASCKKKRQRAAAAPQLTAKQKKIALRKERLLECAFGYWLIEQAKRAGTVQTYHGIDAAGLHGLYAQHNYRKRRYGWVDSGHGKDEYHLCHVQPLKGRDGSVGLTIPENLFTGIAELNQRQGNKPVNTWAGASIPTTGRKRKWNITKAMSLDEVLAKIAAYLGAELDTFLDGLDAIPQRTIRLRLAKAVFRRQGDELFQPLDRSYTLAELGSLKLEELQALDASQRGSTAIKAFVATNCPIDSKLGVLHDELVRFSTVLSEGQHRDNCQSMLGIVRVLGIYLAQIRDAQGMARNRFLAQANATWEPLQYYCPANPWKPSSAMLDADRQMLVTSITEAAQAALQGLNVPAEMLRARLLKRLHLQNLVPVVIAPEQWVWEANESNWLRYIDNLYTSLEPTWQAFLDIGICTEEQVLDAHDAVLRKLGRAIEDARQRYRSQPIYSNLNVPFKRYPKWLEFPPILLTA
jgi:hypothetical protein